MPHVDSRLGSGVIGPDQNFDGLPSESLGDARSGRNGVSGGVDEIRAFWGASLASIVRIALFLRVSRYVAKAGPCG